MTTEHYHEGLPRFMPKDTLFAKPPNNLAFKDYTKKQLTILKPIIGLPFISELSSLHPYHI